MKNKLIFILYDSRSGSTLLASLLNRFRGIDVALESAFVSRIMEINSQRILQDINKLVDYLYQEVQFVELNINRQELTDELLCFKGELTKKYIIEKIVNIYFKDKGSDSKYWVIKHPPYNYIEELILMFPEVKFLQILRDGRAVFNSKKRSKSIGGNYMESNPIISAIDWRLKIKKSNSFPDHVTTIRYKDLIENTESCLSKYLDSLELDAVDKEQTKLQKNYFFNIGDNQKEIHKNVGQTPKAGNIDKWKKELTEREILVYNFVNKKVLKNNGYDIESKSNILFKIFHFTVYAFELIIIKFINIIKLTINPSKLYVKFKRRLLLLR